MSKRGRLLKNLGLTCREPTVERSGRKALALLKNFYSSSNSTERSTLAVILSSLLELVSLLRSPRLEPVERSVYRRPFVQWRSQKTMMVLLDSRSQELEHSQSAFPRPPVSHLVQQESVGSREHWR